jgi:hypothetical protein
MCSDRLGGLNPYVCLSLSQHWFVSSNSAHLVTPWKARSRLSRNHLKAQNLEDSCTYNRKWSFNEENISSLITISYMWLLCVVKHGCEWSMWPDPWTWESFKGCRVILCQFWTSQSSQDGNYLAGPETKRCGKITQNSLQYIWYGLLRCLKPDRALNVVVT